MRSIAGYTRLKVLQSPSLGFGFFPNTSITQSNPTASLVLFILNGTVPRVGRSIQSDLPVSIAYASSVVRLAK